MRVLVDSHTVLWATLDDDRLPSDVRDLIADPGNRIVLSVATIWELTMTPSVVTIPVRTSASGGRRQK